MLPKKSGFIQIIIIVVIILAIAGAAAAGYFYSQSSSQKATQNTSQSQTLPTPDSTANWKTYQGDEFSFKYPMDWPNPQISTLNNELGIYFYLEKTEKMIATVATSNQNFEENKFNLNINEPRLKVSSTIIERNLKGINIVEADVTNTVFDSQGNITEETKRYSVLIPLGKRTIIINTEPQLRSTIDQILSTFKFTDSASTPDSISTTKPALSPTPISTASWKTYTNTKYNYSYKYPDTWYDSFIVSAPCKTCGGVPNGLAIITSDNSAGLSAKQLLQKDMVDEPYAKFVATPSYFSGLDVAVADGFVGAGEPGLHVYIVKNSLVYQILFDGVDNDVQNQILSTFKFTN